MRNPYFLSRDDLILEVQRLRGILGPAAADPTEQRQIALFDDADDAIPDEVLIRGRKYVRACEPAGLF